MPDNAARPVGWSPLTTIRPHYDFGSGGDEIEISNPILRSRYTVTERVLSEMVAAELGAENAACAAAIEFFTDEDVLGGVVPAHLAGPVERWRDRGWEDSLEFYLWTRDCRFVDNPSGETFEAVRDQIIQAFIDDQGGHVPATRPSVAPRPLAAPADLPDEAVGAVLRRRTSTMRPRPRTMSQALLSSVLWHGLTPARYPREDYDSYDALVNLGRLYQLYVVAFDVAGVEAGAYYYSTVHHTLDQIKKGDLRSAVEDVLIGQPHARTASCSIFIAADFRLTQWLYRHDRVLRNVYINAGKVLQDLLLVCTAHGLTTAISAAIKDSNALDLVGLDPAQGQVFYVLSVG